MSNPDFKVVLLGSSAVGKSCLLKRYSQNRYFNNRPHVETTGAHFASKLVSSRGMQFLMGIWDTAGSERFHSMTKLYYRNASAAVVCFSLTDRESYGAAKHWITELRNQEENCKIYLCGTKKDLIDDEIMALAVLPQEIMKYCEGVEAVYMATSSKTGENVVDLFQKITDDYVPPLPASNPHNDSIKLCTKRKTSTCCS